MDNYKLQHMDIDLSKPICRKNVGLVMGSGDEKANTFSVGVKKDGKEVTLTGCTVVGYLIMPNDETIRIAGKVEDNQASVIVPKSGYVYDGAFTLTIKTAVSTQENTLAIFDGEIGRTTSGNIVDGNRVVYGVTDIMNMIDSMDQAEKDAKAAATSANTAAASANSAASKANTASSNANTATAAANNAAQEATTAAGNADNATSAANDAAQTANDAAGRAEVVASKSPYIGDNGNWYVYDVDAGEYVDSGRPSRGATGAVDGLDYFASSPSALGTANPGAANGVARGDHVHPMPTADDVGALANADLLDKLYPVGIIVPFANTVEPAAVWGGTWELLEEGRTVIQSGSTYALGSTGGEAAVQLEVSQMPEHSHDLEYSLDGGATYTAMNLGKDGTVTSDKYGGLSNSVTSFSQYKVRVTYEGNGEPHNNLPPYLAVNIWQRTA